MLISISYDLRKPGRNYDKVYETIKSAPTWCHPMESLWFIRTNESVNTWYERLKKCIDDNDCRWQCKSVPVSVFEKCTTPA